MDTNNKGRLNSIFLVIDNGSETIKAGFADRNEPKIRVPNLVGVRGEKLITGKNESDKTLRSCDKFIYPIEKGNIKNNEVYSDEILTYICDKLGISDMNGANVLITEGPESTI